MPGGGACAYHQGMPEQDQLAVPGLSGIVLAGGKSTRFGSDKAAAILRGRPLLDWVASTVATACAELVVVRARGQELPPLALPRPPLVVEDEYEGLGPLAGIVSGLTAAAGPLAFVVSCDAPLVQASLVRSLAALAADADIVLPVANGFPQPLLAMYRKATCEPVFRAAVDRGDLKITAAFKGLRLHRVDETALREADPGLVSFQNANDPSALAKIEQLLDSSQDDVPRTPAS